MHVLVTGGAGFIGSHLVERLLRDNHRITVIDDFNDYYDPAIKHQNLAAVRQEIEIIEGDIRDAILVERAFARGRFDHVVHLAARAGVRPSMLNPKLYFTTNIDGTFNLLDACRYHEVRDFTFASSSSVYGINRKLPFAETDGIERTISPYAATKLAGEQICSNYSYLYGMNCQCLRFFTVYGPRQRPDLAISSFTQLLLSDQLIPQFGDGSSARDYTYIDDIIDGVVGAMRYRDKSFDIFNLGGSATTTLREMIQILEAATGKTAKIQQLPDQPGDVPATYADVSKARSALGYEPKTNLRCGIQKYVEWQRQQLSSPA